MEKQVEGGGESEEAREGENALGEGLRRGGAGEEQLLRRKGKSDGRKEPGEARGAERRKIGEESRRGWEMTGMRTRERGELEAPLPPPRPAALPA